MSLVRELLNVPDLPRLESRMLLGCVLQKPREWLLAHDIDEINTETETAYRRLVARRMAGEPMAYLLGEREFMGHVLRVTPDVLIPRPDTELLVETALTILAEARFSNRQAVSVLDLGTGSGAIAVSIALACPRALVSATDRSAAALAVARDNAARLGAVVRFLQGDWFDALPTDARFDLIVSNPPYIARDDVHLAQGDLRFEPRGALTDEDDGLADLRRIVAQAPHFLRPGGALWLEHGWDQAGAARDLLREAGFAQVRSHVDISGIQRISGGNL